MVSERIHYFGVTMIEAFAVFGFIALAAILINAKRGNWQKMVDSFKRDEPK